MKAMRKAIGKLGAVAVIGILLAGCAAAPMDKISKFPKTNDGYLIVQTEGLTGVVSAERICDAFPGVKDERCEKKDQYVGARAYTHADWWSVDIIPVLVPKSVGLENKDIIKIRLDGNRPAHFVEFISRGMYQPDCYYDGVYGPGSGGRGGIVCPKANWDYRKDVNR